MTVRCGDIHGMTVPSQRSYHSDLADKSVKFWTAPTKARRAVLERDAKNGTMGAFGSQSDHAGQSPSVASRTSCGQFRLRRAEERILGSGY